MSVGGVSKCDVGEMDRAESVGRSFVILTCSKCVFPSVYLENHRLESSYQNHLVLKVLVVSMNHIFIIK